MAIRIEWRFLVDRRNIKYHEISFKVEGGKWTVNSANDIEALYFSNTIHSAVQKYI